MQAGVDWMDPTPGAVQPDRPGTWRSRRARHRAPGRGGDQPGDRAAALLHLPRGAFAKIGQAFGDWRFLSTVLVLNFVLVPVVVFGLSRIVAHDKVLLVGVLFVLLTPCIDYVLVFAGLAGADVHRLLAATPLLMLAQMLLLPIYLWRSSGPSSSRPSTWHHSSWPSWRSSSCLSLRPVLRKLLPLAPSGGAQLTRPCWGRWCH